MPPKRKAAVNDNETVDRPSYKRKTRSAAVSVKSDPDALPAQPPTRRRGRPPALKHSNPTEQDTQAIPRRNKPQNATDSSSLKENEHTDDEEANDASSEDELQLSPENKRPQHILRGKRVVFESVEISTPLSRIRTYGRKGKEGNVTTPPNALAIVTDDGRDVVEPSPPSPQKSNRLDSFDVRLPSTLPPELHHCLETQKRAVLKALQNPPEIDYSCCTEVRDDDDEDEEPANVTALQQLTSLLTGTIDRSEGNSCLLLGPAGSGKSRIFERALAATCSDKTVVIRLSGHVHTTDRLALREIAHQVINQAGSSLASSSIDKFFSDDGDDDVELSVSGSTVPAAHLPALVSSLSSLSRPVVILLDQFEMFTDHARQALLYCLFDAVQSCRGSGIARSAGLAVIGLTSRIDVINLLEKRVKSRFSHRVLRTAAMRNVSEWTELARQCLCVDAGGEFEDDASIMWSRIWKKNVENFLADRDVKECLRETIGLTRDVRVLTRILMGVIVSLTPASPFLSAGSLRKHTQSQRNPSQFPLLSRLSYPCLSLLIAAEHTRVAGHDSFTFEMLYDTFRTQVRTSSVAPVQLGGVGIGMVGVGRGVMMGAFEHLTQHQIFSLSATPAAGLAKEFIKYRTNVGREDVKAVIERQGPTSLKKWFSKAQ